MPDPQPLRPLTDADREQAKKARDQALLNAKNEGKREGAQAEREKLQPTMNAAVNAATLSQRIDHNAAVAKLEAKHAEALIGARRHGQWRGAALGGALGAVLAAVGTFLIIDNGQKAAFDSAGEYGSQMVATGAAQQMANPPRVCVPGETLPDGRRCPSRDNPQ